MQILHSCKYAMLDCKSDNIMVASGPLGEDIHCTVTDLGSAVKQNKGKHCPS